NPSPSSRDRKGAAFVFRPLCNLTPPVPPANRKTLRHSEAAAEESPCEKHLKCPKGVHFSGFAGGSFVNLSALSERVWRGLRRSVQPALVAGFPVMAPKPATRAGCTQRISNMAISP